MKIKDSVPGWETGNRKNSSLNTNDDSNNAFKNTSIVESNESKLCKKGYLDYVYYILGKQKYDFWVCGTYIKDGEKKFTKWKKYSESVMPIDLVRKSESWKERSYFEQVNQRQILPNEIVLDLEEPERIGEIVENIKIKLDVIKKKTGLDINPKVFHTGSRGYHIHIFFKNSLSENQKYFIMNHLDTDVQKCSDKNLVALEYQPHWKTGNKKIEVNIS